MPMDMMNDSMKEITYDAIKIGLASPEKIREWSRGEVKNPELWQRLVPLLHRHEVEFIWVKGHDENAYNNRCDALAVAESRKFK